jgi:hypothetical protein
VSFYEDDILSFLKWCNILLFQANPTPFLYVPLPGCVVILCTLSWVGNEAKSLPPTPPPPPPVGWTVRDRKRFVAVACPGKGSLHLRGKEGQGCRGGGLREGGCRRKDVGEGMYGVFYRRRCREGRCRREIFREWWCLRRGA